MADKTLKITSIFDQRGAEKVTKATEDLRKVYEQLGRSVKEVQKTLSELDAAQKRNVDTVAKENQVLKEQVDRLKALREAHLGVAQASKAYGSQAGYGGPGAGNSYGSQAGYGNLPGYQRGAMTGGADTSPYLSNPRELAGAFRAAPWMAAAKGLGVAGGLVTGASQLFGAYANWQQHSGRAEAHEKTMGLESLARSQGYRNSVFMESRSAPLGFGAIKDATTFNLRNKDSDKTGVDEFGRLTGPQGQGTTGSEISGRGQDMTGEMREQSGKINAGWAGIGSAAGKGLGGLALMAGGVGTIMKGGAAGAALGSIIPGLGTAAGGIAGGIAGGVAGAGMIGGGAAMIVGAIKEGTAAYFQVHHEEKKLREGEMEARRSEGSEAIEKMKEEILAITKYQMGVFNQFAGMMSSGSRQSLGGVGTAFAQTDFEKGEALSMITGARRGFGRSMGGRGGENTMFEAARRGMSGGAAAQTIGGLGEAGADGGQQLKNLMAQAVKAGMESIDMAFFEKLATASAKSTYGGQGVRDPRVAGLMMAGLYRPTSHQVQENASANGVSGLFQNNSYYRSRDQVNIAGVLGNDATNLRIRTLNQAGLEDLSGGGSASLRSLGIKNLPEVMKRVRESRINEIGSTIRGPEVDSLLGNKSLSEFLPDLVGRLSAGGKKNAGTRAKAENQMELLATALGGVTGEGRNNLIGELRKMGLSDSVLERVFKGRGGMPAGFRRLGSAGTGVVSERNKMENQDIKGGVEKTSDWASAAQLMNNPEFIQENPDLFQKWEGAHGDQQKQQKLAMEINLRSSRFRGNAAERAGSDYDSADKLAKSLGHLDAIINKMASEQMQKDMKKFADNMNKLADSTDRALRRWSTR